MLIKYYISSNDLCCDGFILVDSVVFILFYRIYLNGIMVSINEKIVKWKIIFYFFVIYFLFLLK